MESLVRSSLVIWLIISMLHLDVAAALNKCTLQTLKCQGVNFTSVQCSWSRPSINSKYTVQWKMDSSTICEGSPMINGSYTCDIHDLGRSKFRYIELTVKSHQDNQTQTFKNKYSGLECAIPNPPNDVEVEPLTSNSFQVIWTVPKDWPMENQDLLSYMIEYRSQFDGIWRSAQGSHVQTPPYSQAVINLLYQCSNYEVKIICKRAGATGKQSAWSNIVSVKTTQLAPIGEMHDINFQHLYDKTESRSVLIMWKPIPLTKTCSPLLGYHVMVCQHRNCSTINIAANITRYYVKGLLKGSVYTIYLSAYNVVGQSKSVNITIPALPVTPEAINDKSRERIILYCGLVVPLVILTGILSRLVYYKLKSLFQPVPEPHIPSFPEYKLNPNPYKSACDDKEFYTLLNESNGEQNILRNVEVDKEKEPVYQYRSVSVSDTGELEVVEYQLLLCEDYVKPPSEKDLIKPPSEKDSSHESSSGSYISPYAKLADGAIVEMSSTAQPLTSSTAQDTSSDVNIKASNINLKVSSLRADSSKIAKQGQLLEKMLQQRKCKFIVCREDGYAVIVEDVRHLKTEETV